jgi:hypothetical protein
MPINAKDMEETGRIVAKTLRLEWIEDSIINLGTLGSCVEIH